MGMGRTDIIDDILTLLKNATSTNLVALADSSIEYGLRTSQQIHSVQHRKGIFVDLAGFVLNPENIGGSKQELLQTVEITLYCVGHDATADARYIAALLEEIEAVLWASANRILAHGAWILAEPEGLVGPPLGNAEMTIHWCAVNFNYRKSGAL